MRVEGGGSGLWFGVQPHGVDVPAHIGRRGLPTTLWWHLADVPCVSPTHFYGKGRPPMSTSVTCELHLRLVVSSESSLPVPAGLRYDSADPYAVHATFHTGAQETVDWVFARELLSEGLRRPTGCGDVRVWPSRNRGQGIVCIALSSPEGEALLEAPARALESFLKRTNAAVPPGTEPRHYDIDAELAHLFAGS
jgi:hypothetical protein